MAKGIHWIDWVSMSLYALALLGIALYHSRKMIRRDDVFLAGRSMSRWPIAISMYMAVFSTNTFLGTTGWVSRPHGTVWIGLHTFGILFSIPLIVELYPALFFRLKITSAYEYLELRFNRSVQIAATIFFLGARLMWMATILYSASLVVTMMFGWTPANGVHDGQFWAILIIGVLATTFTWIGGMRAVIWTDVMQFGVLLSGVICMIVLGLSLSGGFGNVVRIGNEFHRFAMPSVFSLTDELSLMGGLLVGFISMLSSCGADQVLLQQYLTAKSECEAKASIWRNGLFLKPVSLIYPFLGVIMFAYYRIHPEVASLMRIPDDALPVFVTNVLPPGARGLMVMAMVAAVLTSVQSGLTAVSATIQVNFVQRKIRRSLTDRESVLLARALLLITGVTIIAVAFWVRGLGQQNSVVQILNIVVNPFAGVLLGIFLLGILSRRANSPGSLIGGILGFLGTIAIPASRVIVPASLQTPALQYLGRISNFYFGFLGTILTVAAGYGASLLFAPPAESHTKGLTRLDLPQSAAPARTPVTVN